MIITRTPFRVSFFGGGTDFPEWFRENGGSVLSTTIDKYCYITCRALPQFFDHKHRIVYSKIENVNDSKDINHPVARVAIEMFGGNVGLEIHHDGDLPARSGLGSSSSFTVGLINAINALKGQYMSKYDLAQLAIEIEQKILKENVGCQDQVAVAYGGFNKIKFNIDGSFSVIPLICPKERVNQLANHLMLFFTGISRNSTEIAEAQIENIKNRTSILKDMQRQVDRGIEILTDLSVNIDEFGQLLHQAWLLKKSLSNKITTVLVEDMYAAALRSGATGGKVLGAGGGGFLLLFVKPDRQKSVLKALKNYIHVPVSFDNDGSRVIYYNP